MNSRSWRIFVDKKVATICNENVIVLRSFGKKLATNWSTWRSVGELKTIWQLLDEQMANVVNNWQMVSKHSPICGKLFA